MYGVIASVFKNSPLACRLIGQKNGLRMTYYHRVNAQEDSYYFNTGISPEAFAKQLDHLQARFNIISLSEALDKTKAGKSLNGDLCISFDDGFRECYTHIFPELKARGIKATFYLIADCLNNQHLMWRNQLLHIQSQVSPTIMAELIASEGHEPHAFKNLIAMSDAWAMAEKDQRADRLWKLAGLDSLSDFLAEQQPYLNDNQVQEMLADGQEMGLHTKSHPFCDLLSDEEVQSEIIAAYAALNARFGITMNSLSYPFGRRCSAKHEALILKSTGLEALLGIHEQLANGTDAAKWERQGMEMPYAKSIAGFYLVPWKRSS